MFVKTMIIAKGEEVIRTLTFQKGLNLIIDQTPEDDIKTTGNNIGKTTVLKLIDFCLGAKPHIIYSDTENKKDEYDLVKQFLIEEQVKVTLILGEEIEGSSSRDIAITRNFLSYKRAIREINGKQIPEKDFEAELESVLFPQKNVEKPTFRQIISHNIRYRDESINNTLKTLNGYTTDVEYETLYLFLLGCNFNRGAEKQALIVRKNQETAFKDRLEKKQTKTAYELALSLIDAEIEDLDERKQALNLNPDFSEDLDNLNAVKAEINKLSAVISKLEIRKSLIEDAVSNLNKSYSEIDVQQLKTLYNEVSVNVSQIQKTFEDLLAYHNKMIVEKVKYIAEGLPEINEKIVFYKQRLQELTQQEKTLTQKVFKGDSFEELECIISELNEKYRSKGEYESIVSQITEAENNIVLIDEKIAEIDEFLFSNDFESIVKKQLMKFNRYFASISQELYGERYALTYEKIKDKKDRQYYKFKAFNANMSSGKKQGEILCFDLAHILFSHDEQIPCMSFLLNDKKELMHDNQLIKVADYISDKDIQLVISILKDKLPSTIMEKSHIVVELSQKEKLFKIE